MGSSSCSGPENGRGIYNVERGNYCIEGPNGLRFCPNAFVRPRDGRAAIGGWLARGSSGTETLFPINAFYEGKPVTLRELRGQNSELVVSYEDAGGQRDEVSGPELVKLRFEFSIYETPIQMRFSNYGGLRDGIREYGIEYLNPFISGWTPLCRDVAGSFTTASFVDGWKVHPLNANLTEDSRIVTLSCERGAIAQCLRWGYRPSEHEDAYGACLQMKRAAYCGEESHTLDGTPILITDRFRIQKGNVATRLEALWRRGGAACLNPGNRRRPELPFAGCASLLPLCPPSPDQWWTQGEIASGPL